MNDPQTNAKTLIHALSRREIPETELLARLSTESIDWEFRIPENNGQTLLMILAWYPSLCTPAVTKCVMEKVPNTAIQLTNHQSTALHNAATSNNVHLVTALLEIMTNETSTQKNWERRTAMEEAAIRGNKEVLNVFLSNGILDAKVVRWSLAHCNCERTTDVLKLILNSSLPVYEDFNALKKNVEDYFEDIFMEMDHFDIRYYNAVLHELDVGARKQNRYREKLNAMLPLIPVLTSIIQKYIW